MTSETRTLIDLSDISGIELECPHCRAKMLYPIDQNYGRLEGQCPNCKEVWFASNSSSMLASEPTIAIRVRNAIDELRKISEDSRVRAHVRLQIKGVSADGGV